MLLQEVIDRSIQVLTPLVEKEYEKDLDFPSKLVFFHTVERILRNLHLLRILTNEITPETEHGINLVLRNMLSDFIVNCYVINKSKDLDESDDFFTSLIHLDIQKIDSYIKCLNEHELITKEECEKYFNDQESNPLRNEVFERKRQKKLKNFPNNKSIFESLVSNNSSTEGNWKQDIIDAYDIWVLLSKYEHIGWNSYQVSRIIEGEKVESRILITIKKVLFLGGNIFEYLDEKFDPKEIVNIWENINVD